MIKLDGAHMKGALWMLAWTVAFSASMTMVKFIGHDVPVAMKMATRLIFGLSFISPFLFKAGVQNLKTKRLTFHFLRTFLMLGAMFCTYYAYSHLPIAFATSIGFTAPLMTTLLARLILKEEVGAKRWVAMFFGYMGVLVMVRPGFVDIEPAMLMALLANVLASASIIAIKQLTKTESTLQIMFYFNIISVVITSVVACFHWQMPSHDQLILLSILGGTGIFSQFCSARAYHHAQPSFLAPIEYLRLVIAVPVGIFAFGEYPDVWTLVGSLIIIATTLYITLHPTKQVSSNA